MLEKRLREELELADYRLHQCFRHEAILSLPNWI
jgi:hypothetical protein